VFVYFYFYFKTLEFVLDREVEIDSEAKGEVSFIFNDENDMFVTKEYNGQLETFTGYIPLRIWNSKTGVLVKELDEDGHPVAFIRSRYIALAYCSEIRIYDKDDEFNLIATLDEENMDDEYNCIQSLVFSQSRNQNLLVSGYENGTVKVWDAKTWSLIKTLSAHTDRVHSIVFDKKNLVATASNNRTIKIWKTDTWDLVQTLDGGNRCFQVAFTHNNMLVVLKKFSSIQIFCSESWSVTKTLEDTGSEFRTIAISKSNLLAVACDGGKILIFNTKNWDLFQKLEAHDDIIGELFIDKNDVISYRYDYGKVMKWKIENDFLNSIYNQ
jgi:WD40 repeat protein